MAALTMCFADWNDAQMPKALGDQQLCPRTNNSTPKQSRGLIVHQINSWIGYQISFFMPHKRKWYFQLTMQCRYNLSINALVASSFCVCVCNAIVANIWDAQRNISFIYCFLFIFSTGRKVLLLPHIICSIKKKLGFSFITINL